MNLRHLVIGAVLLLGMSRAAAAQSPAPEATGTSGRDAVVAVVDVGRLPIDMSRIERSFRKTTIREERDGLNLRYFVDVYAKAPPIVLLTPADNLRYGPVPYGGPTHGEMLQMMTPQAFRASGMMLGSGVGVPRKKSDNRK
jgi:hypothetical protein